MLRFCAGLVLLGLMTLCMAHDAMYYQLNPNKIEKVLSLCPVQKEKNVSCDELKEIAIKVNTLSYELRMDPQGFGKTILKLQEDIAKQQVAMSAESPTAQLQSTLAKAEHELQARLAIVKWLESPES